MGKYNIDIVHNDASDDKTRKSDKKVVILCINSRRNTNRRERLLVRMFACIIASNDECISQIRKAGYSIACKVNKRKIDKKKTKLVAVIFMMWKENK